ncbi:MAG: BtpA/SgcQ family protein [Candidatus Asgardarchaeia archaeon]
MFEDIFKTCKPIIGMIHLKALPGSPKFESLDIVVDYALKDAEALEQGGVDGVLIENISDVPYFPVRVPPETVSAMTYVTTKISEKIKIPFGVNVLRRDAKSALAIAFVTGGRYIRTNVLIGAYVTDQGIIEANAHELLRYRRFLGADIKIFADIRVKYASPLYDRPIELEAEDAVYRGLADAVVVSGLKTGTPPDIQLIEAIKDALKGTPVLIGSGLTDKNAENLLSIADGAIVGSAFKKGGVFYNPVDKKRVEKIMHIVEKIR